MTAHERSGWRCEDISRRHREWGYNCPAVDLDFVVAEYNHGLPVALAEYKHERARFSTDHPTYNALRALADGFSVDGIPKPLPFFVARYCPRDWWFRVIPLNEPAMKHYAPGRRDLSEQRFVRSLYMLRKRVLDEHDERAIGLLNTIPPGGSPEQIAPWVPRLVKLPTAHRQATSIEAVSVPLARAPRDSRSSASLFEFAKRAGIEGFDG